MEKLNVYATNIGEGLAGIFATKGYLEETKEPGVYVVTERGFEEAVGQPREESPETRAPSVKEEQLDTQTVADTAEDKSYSESQENYQNLANQYVTEFIDRVRSDEKVDEKQAQALIQQSLEAASENLQGADIAKNQEKILEHMHRAVAFTKKGNKRKKFTKEQKSLLRVVKALQYTLDQDKTRCSS